MSVGDEGSGRSGRSLGSLGLDPSVSLHGSLLIAPALHPDAEPLRAERADPLWLGPRAWTGLSSGVGGVR